jgi:hypothetical protein
MDLLPTKLLRTTLEAVRKDRSGVAQLHGALGNPCLEIGEVDEAPEIAIDGSEANVFPPFRVDVHPGRGTAEQAREAELLVKALDERRKTQGSQRRSSPSWTEAAR